MLCILIQKNYNHYWTTISKLYQDDSSKWQAALAQLAARKPHNLKVVSSVLTCRMFCISDLDTLQTQLNNHMEIVSRWFFDNAKWQWRSRQRVSLIILRSRVRSSPVACFIFLIETHYKLNQVAIVTRWFSDIAKRKWRSRQRVSPIILRSWVRYSLVFLCFVLLIQKNYNHNWTTISKSYQDDFPIRTSDIGAVGSA